LCHLSRDGSSRVAFLKGVLKDIKSRDLTDIVDYWFLHLRCEKNPSRDSALEDEVGCKWGRDTKETSLGADSLIQFESLFFN